MFNLIQINPTKMPQETLYKALELFAKNASRDGETYRGDVEGRDTLVKVVSDPEERHWLRHEARILEKLSDTSHAPKLYNFVEGEDNKSYLAEQFVEGTSLKEILGGIELDEHQPIEPMTPVDAAGIVNRIGAAEIDLLTRGVMYRDLQTAHIVFAKDDRRAVFIDMGLATDDSYIDANGTRKWRQTEANGIHTTMSPNELKGGDMTEADVVYRLAVIYHVALTGELPFKQPKRPEMAEWIKNPRFTLSNRLTGDGRELFENALFGDPKRQIKSVDLFLAHMNRLKHKTIKPPLAGAAGLVTEVNR